MPTPLHYSVVYDCDPFPSEIREAVGILFEHQLGFIWRDEEDLWREVGIRILRVLIEDFEFSHDQADDVQKFEIELFIHKFVLQSLQHNSSGGSAEKRQLFHIMHK